jgi:hypothetical protein
MNKFAFAFIAVGTMLASSDVLAYETTFANARAQWTYADGSGDYTVNYTAAVTSDCSGVCCKTYAVRYVTFDKTYLQQTRGAVTVNSTAGYASYDWKFRNPNGTWGEETGQNFGVVDGYRQYFANRVYPNTTPLTSAYSYETYITFKDLANAPVCSRRFNFYTTTS